LADVSADGTHDNLRNLGLDALDVVNLRVGGFARGGRAGGQRPAEIVGDAHHVAGEFGHGILAGLGAFLVGAAADILHLRQGAQALALSQMGADEGRGRIVDCLVDLFGPQANEHIGYARKDWLADEWSRGGAGFMGPGVVTGYGAALRASCGRIHWASSETATQWAGYMEGALQSGERAAEDVTARLSP